VKFVDCLAGQKGQHQDAGGRSHGAPVPKNRLQVDQQVRNGGRASCYRGLMGWARNLHKSNVVCDALCWILKAVPGHLHPTIKIEGDNPSVGHEASVSGQDWRRATFYLPRVPGGRSRFAR